MNDWEFADYPRPGTSRPRKHIPNADVTKDWADYYWIDCADSLEAWQWTWDDMEADKLLASRMTKEQFFLWAVTNVHGQIGNGGFSMILSNSYGQLAEEAVIGLRHFDMHEYADVIERGLDLFPVRPIPRKREERNNIFENMNDEHYSHLKKSWNEIASEIYKKDSSLDYGRENKNDISIAFYRPLKMYIFDNFDRFFL